MSNLVIGDYALDNGLVGLAAVCDKIFICSSEPATYTDATSTFALGSQNFGAGAVFGSPAAGSPTGRKITSAPIASANVSANGTVVRWAAVDSANSRLLAEGALSGGQAVNTTEFFSLAAIPLHVFGTGGTLQSYDLSNPANSDYIGLV